MGTTVAIENSLSLEHRSGPWTFIPPTREVIAARLYVKYGRKVRRRLRKLHENRGDLRVYSASLTFAKVEDGKAVYSLPYIFTRKVMQDRRAGVWFVLEFGEKDHRPHWHGVIVSSKPQAWLTTQWSDIAGGTAAIKVVTGQDEGWAMPVGDTFRKNLNRVIRYALKATSGGVEIPLGCWIIAAGFLKKDWIEATGIHVADPETKLVRATISGNCHENAEPVPMRAHPARQPRLDPGKAIRDCRNHDKCRGRIYEFSATGRRTRKDCELCEECALVRDDGFAHRDDGHRSRHSHHSKKSHRRANRLDEENLDRNN